MAEMGQNFTMYAGNYVNVSFAFPSDKAEVVAARWALADATSRNILLSKSTDEGGGVEMLEGMMVITLDPADTATLSGYYYHECLGLDSDGNPVTMAVGVARIEPTILKVLN